MKISSHRLLDDDGSPFPFVQSPHGGAPLRPRWLVMHYTADGGSTAVDWFKNPASKASAHLVISRQGRVTQMMAFDRVAFHAGKSEWQGVSGLNRHSIGIEMVNYGELFQHPTKGWMRYWRQEDGSFKWIGPAVPEAELMLDGARAVDGTSRPRAWQRYTDAQVDAAFRAARALVEAYRLEDVVGHEEISPGRKTDPGPAFGIAKFRERVMRREHQPDAPRFIVTTTLNIHAGPALTHPTVAGSPLAQNTEVEALEDQDGWVRVAVRGPGGITGWLPTTFLKTSNLPAGQGG
ncbi:MAG TPA: N-acetylmuramoyl-L-alanine amidase [Longimicrobium sp.]|jgi:N-acetylmuramoyl-L-alanine amidase|uniref:N-acetylmuramoyl-L-alanine amidase n=1 Tax=Longimicrobium sp. TaxID=2029185 RepID=UPI002EDB1B2B